jgi:hypothetical protein
MNDYYSKYLKYKNKYIKLKQLKSEGLLPLINKKEIDNLNKNINTKCEYNNSTMIRGINCPMIYCKINKTFPFNFCLSNEI